MKHEKLNTPGCTIYCLYTPALNKTTLITCIIMTVEKVYTYGIYAGPEQENKLLGYRCRAAIVII